MNMEKATRSLIIAFRPKLDPTHRADNGLIFENLAWNHLFRFAMCIAFLDVDKTEGDCSTLYEILQYNCTAKGFSPYRTGFYTFSPLFTYNSLV